MTLLHSNDDAIVEARETLHQKQQNYVVFRRQKQSLEKCSALKGTVCLHKMIDPTLGWLTKICLYLP